MFGLGGSFLKLLPLVFRGVFNFLYMLRDKISVEKSGCVCCTLTVTGTDI
ncbi:hypothetical protein C1G86_1470 [Dehalococcoides mccartyi]|uniref:Uncharacterized protein n=1 Tax=Dehalococcoides mccartyi TaxID=61435 RepID=A0A142VC19_9CHLR|nr:hypothetical protein dcmb_1426 [Dehalococcoides mccartyi DCMB5]AMU87219.1 hypothetical protein Dm11a5_1393 [Dehalococcoides mccartyi]RAL68952.1 hypothetical protein C1G87_1431 [Dehalococcoides mccartyi]RAL70140.1 hypothetical protein C1G86_1470 [Dehalococcoides mccartyi]